MDKKIAYNVKTIINEKGIKQKKIAEILNVSSAEVSKLVNGKLSIKAKTLYTISKFLNVDMETFFKGVDI